MMAWKTALATTIVASCLGHVLAEHTLWTKHTISELQAGADDAAALEAKYKRVSANAPDEVADTDPSLLYRAYNLSVPTDHFHNDSLYEPHVCP